jgi:hypothetical protein
MAAIWIVVLTGGLVAATLATTWWRHAIDMPELGTVSHAWLAEHWASSQH